MRQVPTRVCNRKVLLPVDGELQRVGVPVGDVRPPLGEPLAPGAVIDLVNLPQLHVEDLARYVQYMINQ